MDIYGIPTQSTVKELTSGSNETNQIAKATTDFADLLKSTVNQVAESQSQGDAAIVDLNSGKAQNLHDVMIAVEQADLSLRMLVQLRNKALEAYNTILKINV